MLNVFQRSEEGYGPIQLKVLLKQVSVKKTRHMEKTLNKGMVRSDPFDKKGGDKCLL